MLETFMSRNYGQCLLAIVIDKGSGRIAVFYQDFNLFSILALVAMNKV
jgi:hypothetical protein